MVVVVVVVVVLVVMVMRMGWDDVAGRDAANANDDSQHLYGTTWLNKLFKGAVWRCGGGGCRDGSTSSCGSDDVFGGTCNDEDIEVAVVAMVRMMVEWWLRKWLHCSIW